MSNPWREWPPVTRSNRPTFGNEMRSIVFRVFRINHVDYAKAIVAKRFARMLVCPMVSDLIENDDTQPQT